MVCNRKSLEFDGLQPKLNNILISEFTNSLISNLDLRFEIPGLVSCIGAYCGLDITPLLGIPPPLCTFLVACVM